MPENVLIKKSSWDIPLDEFKSRILKEIYLNPLIDSDIRLEIEVIYDLLLHSYYNSNFIDEAYTKAIFILEKVLRIRGRELKNGLNKKDDLFVLFKWFFDHNYFETTEVTDLHQLRKIRNKKVHDPKIFKGFLNFLINIYAIFDLINDVYENIDLRLERREKTKLINEQLNSLCNNGFILEINELPYFCHFVSVLFYNNKLSREILHLRIARCIVSEIAQVGADRDNYELVSWSFNNDQFNGKLKTGEAIRIKPLIDIKQVEQFKSWQNKYPLWSLELFDSFERSAYQEKLREFHRI